VTNATLQSSGALFLQWRTERTRVVGQVASLRLVISQSSALSSKDIAELRSSVGVLAERMQSHFRSETETYDALREELGCIEVETAKRQAEADQVHLLSRLTRIREQLEGSREDVVGSFEAVTEKLDWLFDDLDQHHERECESIEWLSKHGCE
jgi:hypothetical protein